MTETKNREVVTSYCDGCSFPCILISLGRPIADRCCYVPVAREATWTDTETKPIRGRKTAYSCTVCANGGGGPCVLVADARADEPCRCPYGEDEAEWESAEPGTVERMEPAYTMEGE